MKDNAVIEEEFCPICGKKLETVKASDIFLKFGYIDLLVTGCDKCGIVWEVETIEY